MRLLSRLCAFLSFFFAEMKCILIFLLILVCGFFASDILALKCVTPDGLQVDEVRKVIKKCMKKVTATDFDADHERNYEEYENFEGNYESESENRKDKQQQQQQRKEGGNARHRSNDRMNNYNNPSRIGHDYDYSQTGGNYHEEMNRRRNDDRHDPSQYNPYQYTYGDNDNFNNQRGNFHYSSSSSNGRNKNNNNNDNSTAAAAVDIDKHERDRSCILQCFFSELKMVCLNE